jgi:hypothetical protein
MLKVEIKVNEKGYCDKFKINGKEIGKDIRGYGIEHYAGNKPRLVLDLAVDDLIIEVDNFEIDKGEEQKEDK